MTHSDSTMAGSGYVRQSLRNAHELQPFVISNIRPIGKQLGRGSYGSVEKLEMDGVVCAGKTIYDTLIDPGNQGAQRVVEMYLRECNVLSQLRHPHVVQFLGICFLPHSQLPVLVMELLQGSLDYLLETRPNIPLPTKLSILHDVARGLVYLHNHNPVIIHRDLTARNILLNPAMTAKIADMGNSRIVDIPPGQVALSMTPGIPGTMVYMPPEAFGSQHKYGPSLDMFSFGHLALFTAIQVFPQDLLAPNYYDSATSEVKGRTELERRAQYIDILHNAFHSDHGLVTLIKHCLEYEPVRRPTARQAMERLGNMRVVASNPYTDMDRLELESSLRQNEEEIQRLRYECERLTGEQAQLREACTVKGAQFVAMEVELQEIPQLKTELRQAKIEKTACEAVIAAKELEIADKDHSLLSLQQTCASLQTQLRSLQTKIQSLENEPRPVIPPTGENLLVAKDAHIASLQGELREKRNMLQNRSKLSNTLGVLTLSLSLVWKDPIELPSGVSQAQAVVIGGRLYIAGIESENGVYKITEYSIESGRSREIDTPVCWFGMAAVNDQLIIAGGQSSEGESDRVWVMNSHTRTWTEPFPGMPTARESPSAVGYGRWVLVVGGWGSRYVELLDTVSQQWYTTLPLPSEAIRPSLAVIEDTLYIAWDDIVVSASIPALISHAFPNASNSRTMSLEWQQLPQTLTNNPSIAAFHGTLLAVGGEPLSSSITVYLPLTEEWMNVSKLPTPRTRCVCVFIPDTGKLLVISGRGKRMNFIRSIEVCTL